MESLIDDILLLVFQNLDHIGLYTVSLVCRRFYAIATRDILWNRLSVEEFGIPTKGEKGAKAIYREWKNVKLIGLKELTWSPVQSISCAIERISYPSTMTRTPTKCLYIPLPGQRILQRQEQKLLSFSWACVYIAITNPNSKVLLFSEHAQEIVHTMLEEFLCGSIISIRKDVRNNPVESRHILHLAIKLENGSQIYCNTPDVVEENGPISFNQQMCSFDIGDADKCFLLLNDRDISDDAIPFLRDAIRKNWKFLWIGFAYACNVNTLLHAVEGDSLVLLFVDSYEWEIEIESFQSSMERIRNKRAKRTGPEFRWAYMNRRSDINSQGLLWKTEVIQLGSE